MARKKSKEELNLDNVELDENGEPVESKGSKLTSFLVGLVVVIISVSYTHLDVYKRQVQDMALKQNECMIETDSGVFNCSLDVELHNLIKQIKL